MRMPKAFRFTILPISPTCLTGRPILTWCWAGYLSTDIEEKDGKKIEHFRSINPNVSEQTISIGVNTVLSSGVILRSVTYTTRNPQHVLNLIAQAKSGRLTMKFQGSDIDNNIYVFDNDFYHVKMYISTSENKGSVVIEQKDFISY